MATTLRLSPVTSPKNVCSQLNRSVVVIPASNFSRELLRGGCSSWTMSPDSSASASVANCNLSLVSGSPRNLSSPGKHFINGGVSSSSCGSPMTANNDSQIEEIPNSMNKSCSSIEEQMGVEGSNDPDTAFAEEQLPEAALEDPVLAYELSETGIDSICSLKLTDSVSVPPKEESSGEQTSELASDLFISHEKNPSSYYNESGGSAKVSNSGDFVESGKTSICRGSTSSDVSEDSSSSSVSSSMNKPHRANDSRCEAIQAIRSQDGVLGLNHFRILRRLGGGDIGSVYLSELTGTRNYFAMKVMDKAALASRKKLVRAQTEREILQTLDHPFLPTLYTHFETEKFSCLVMEFCPGGDLHALRQRQPGKRFSEHAARFYVAEVLLALEYLHMLGIIYRDLKPENVLVRDDGHIMLSDFDLSLTCAVCPTLVRSSKSAYYSQPDSADASCVIQPACIQPTCFMPRFLSRKSKNDKKDKKDKKAKPKNEVFHQVTARPELIAEPTDARSMSFVGTHEYLAPEIIKGEGHGSAVDWWMFGIFLFELLYGKTPFKGAGNRATLLNVVGQPLRFPESPSVSFAARDLIRGLLVKDPQHRLAHRRGATEIRQHPFFQCVNWALIRGTNPPEVPKPFISEIPKALKQENVPVVDVKPSGNYLEIDFF